MNERELRLWLTGQALQIADSMLNSTSFEDAAKELGISTSQYKSNTIKYANTLLAKRAMEIADAIIEEEQRTYRSN